MIKVMVNLLESSEDILNEIIKNEKICSEQQSVPEVLLYI